MKSLRPVGLSLAALSAALAALFASPVAAQEILPTTGISFPVLGRVAPRPAKDVQDSHWWSVGGETLDRDFATFARYESYLGPLGAKGLRLQAGWAKCERQPRVYDWTWLDAIIDGAVAQGVRPWLELSYGNLIYPGGGDTGLGGGFPSSPEALAAWDAWVRALVSRYKDRVREWEVWNEPDLNSKGTAPASAYVDLYIRTATAIRASQPDAKVWALALAHTPDYADAFLAGMVQKGKLSLIDAITFHGYPRNPDDTTLVDKLRAIVAKHGAAIELRQGETGAPSRYQENFALAKITWTETTQAKWDLRRLLAHRAKDVPMNLFTMSDLHYRQANGSSGAADGVLRMNYKGLLATNPDQSISYAKPVYSAAQSTFALFGDAVKRLPDFTAQTSALRSVAVAGYRHDDGGQLVTLWFNDAPPSEANGTTPADLTLAQGQFAEPTLIDLRTSTVYVIPRENWTQGPAGAAFRALPLYDSPVVIAERRVVPVATPLHGVRP